MKKLDLQGRALIDKYKRITGCQQTIVAFSRGKDSVAMTLAIRDHFNIVPVHYYMVPDLPFVEESLAYYERCLFHRRIIRYPHPLLYHWLDLGVYQPLANCDLYAASGLGDPMGSKGMQDYGQRVRKWIVEQEKLKENPLIAVGVKAHDSPQRWMSFQKHGAIRPTAGAWYPIWDMKKAELQDLIRNSGIRLPIDYRWFGRSFDGLDVQYLVPLKRESPKDYQKILEWFPLIDLEVWKYERAIKANPNSKQSAEGSIETDQSNWDQAYRPHASGIRRGSA